MHLKPPFDAVFSLNASLFFFFKIPILNLGPRRHGLPPARPRPRRAAPRIDELLPGEGRERERESDSHRAIKKKEINVECSRENDDGG